MFLPIQHLFLLLALLGAGDSRDGAVTLPGTGVETLGNIQDGPDGFPITGVILRR